ncbi:BON domain-containing protein [Lysobacter firmicutimachus]|uniref:BON domain-containing protein n=1 Tax=Lysobacter firmicutimachus TaxID=1792846 RepID=A0AAU8MZB8_9GAMM
MNSEKLRRYVLQELGYDPRVDASGIGVSVEDRFVRLTGHVPSLADKYAVASAAARVRGVRGVIVDVEVRCASETCPDDELIARRAVEVLAWDATLPKDSVTVVVDKGRVLLTGMVDWQYQRNRVETDLRRLAGVSSIDNRIEIRRVSCREDVKRSIKDAMRRRADLESERVRVEVDEQGEVVLKGKVADWRARNAVEDAAWLVAGVRAVDNRVRVR